MVEFSPETIAELLEGQQQRPPIESWHPELSGDIDILIRTDGRWFHDGDEIKRFKLTQLFASILRREEDGCYYLLTPVEKWRIRVDAHPFIITDYRVEMRGGKQCILCIDNVNRHWVLSKQNPLLLDNQQGTDSLPYIQLDRGLSAQLSRNVFYHFVEMGYEESGKMYLDSAGDSFSLGALS